MSELSLFSMQKKKRPNRLNHYITPRQSKLKYIGLPVKTTTTRDLMRSCTHLEADTHSNIQYVSRKPAKYDLKLGTLAVA